MEGIYSDIFYKTCSAPTAKTDDDYNIEVCIEISKNSSVKYEYDKARNALVCDRVLHTPFKYIFNYGFIPNTLSEDGDPIDAIVVMEDELVPGSYIKCRLIGVLETSDDKGVDPKLIMTPATNVDPCYSTFKNIYDINPATREKIKYFFSHYKDLEGKSVTIGEFKNRDFAHDVYNNSVTIFTSQPASVNKITNYYKRA